MIEKETDYLEKAKEIIDSKELSRLAKGSVLEIIESCRNSEYKNIPLPPNFVAVGEIIWKDGHHRGWVAGMKHARKMLKELEGK